MDFNRSAQPQQPAAQTARPAVAPASASKKNNNDSKWVRIGVVTGVFLVAALLVAAILSLLLGGSNNSKEASFVDSSKLQAVFLNTGQVYFGNIKELNNKYFEVTNIYYLQTANASGTSGQQAANTSVSLVKLGCELHEPFDKMLINRDQVTFWENLQGGGQVAKAVSTFEKQNPNGQKCADQSNSSTNTSNAVQNAGTNNSATTPAAGTATPSTTTTNP